MKIRLITDSNQLVGECDVDPAKPYLGLLLYITALWATEGEAISHAATTIRRAAPEILTCLTSVLT